MKHLMYFLLFGLMAILFTSCRQSLASLDNVASQQDESSIYVLRFDGDQAFYEVMNLPQEASGPAKDSEIAYKNGNSAHTHGEFTGYGGGTTISFSGTENNGGTHGSAELIKVNGTLKTHVVMETSCVVVIGDEAFYGGLITEVKENTIPPPPPPPPGVPAPTCDPFDLGSYVYFRVLDNGQGNNAPTDQYYGALITACPANVSSDCFSSWPFWFFFSPIDVDNASDNIKVN